MNWIGEKKKHKHNTTVYSKINFFHQQESVSVQESGFFFPYYRLIWTPVYKDFITISELKGDLVRVFKLQLKWPVDIIRIESNKLKLKSSNAQLEIIQLLYMWFDRGHSEYSFRDYARFHKSEQIGLRTPWDM